MSFRVTNTFVNETTLSAADLDQNFTDVEAKFNQGITGQDLSPTANITNGQLQNSQYEILLSHCMRRGSTAFPLRVATAAPAPSPALGPNAVIGLPGTLALGDYEIYQSDIFVSNAGAGGTLTYTLQIGDESAAPGVWTQQGDITAIGATQSITAAGITSKPVTLSVIPVPVLIFGSIPLSIGIFLHALPVGVLDTPDDYISFSFRMRRAGGLGS